MDSLIVDCSTCQVRGVGCADCVMTVLFEPAETGHHHFDADEQAAVAALAGSGLVPPLRLVRPGPGAPGEPPGRAVG
ncbi:hypothetical protein ACSDQ9_10860 [Aestuariimicrobium soli]|uniref:hypothetical protein n=1 Tax=Aestuariimicrobium soli TaxID=2035834 RepID=UPI003EBD8DE7